MTIDDASPLFDVFWANSELNGTRARLLRERIAADAAQPYEAPEPVYAGAARRLPIVRSSLTAAYEGRRSGREFSAAALSTDDLAHLLAPFAMRRDGTRPLPSGGGKYPVWIYAALLGVEDAPDLAGRICWYDPRTHGLSPIGDCPSWNALQSVLGTSWDTAPSAVFFVVAKRGPMTAKYGERGGRFMLMEAGGYLVALSLAAAERQLAAVALGSFLDRQVLSLLGLASDEHLSMFAFAAGRPAGIRS
ncbi:nitroreductase [Azoarcus sp. CIB]|uniref:SagB/ThcOx family dehydrogenase n=1 Tax=Aromatoleum sp. (strain CIB) TaxID=198107 RepID=UPI00067B6780|nr:SagB/ThcOx family dehydrogenase [Azoarcus sp. CIB]AKU14234.1 nitroreductase [Azoarcus sp. CIB]